MKNIFNKNLAIRTLSGSIYVGILLLALLVSTPWILFALYAFCIILGIIEFNTLTKVFRLRPFRAVLDSLAGVWLLYATLMYTTNRFGISIYTPYMSYILYVLGRSVFSDPEKLLNNVGNSLLSQVLIALPFSLGIYMSVDGWSNFNGAFLLGLYLLTWANDTGAYIVGVSFGKHKMLPKISPKKSFEGLIGGIIITIIVASILPLILSSYERFSLYELLILGFVVSLGGTLGDLFESTLKRNAQVKDSGSLIPGHGGILDRSDSLLFILPIVFILSLICL